MAKLSKYYRVTNQILLEFISNSDIVINDNTNIGEDTSYMLYLALDNQLYYLELIQRESNVYDYSDMKYFVKLPDKSDSEYTYNGLTKVDIENLNGIYYNSSIWDYIINNNEIVNSSILEHKILHDKIRIHLIYGFMLDNLAGYTLLLLTNAKTLKPKLKITGYNHLETDEDGYPVFVTRLESSILIDGDSQSTSQWKVINLNIEPLLVDTVTLTLLDYYFPKECMILNDIVKYHKTPIYQNGAFYDRYIDINVPSIYLFSLDSGLVLKVPSVYGTSNYFNPYDIDTGYNTVNKNYNIRNIDGSIYSITLKDFTDPNYIKWYNEGKYDLLPQYAISDPNPLNRSLYLTVLPDPEIIINFATVYEDNSIQDLTNPEIYYKQTFFQDPINQIAFNYRNNSDLFNIKIFEDTDNAEIIYYPVFGLGDNVVELDYNIMNQIETGLIPMISEGFLDKMQDIDDFAEKYGEQSYKWIICNDLFVTYNYSPNVLLDDTLTTIDYSITEHFSNIIDYGLYDYENAGEFWKSTFIPKVKTRANMNCKSILIEYTGRLVNRLSNVEAIRKATLLISDPTKYMINRIVLNNVVTYKIVNQIKKQEISIKETTKQGNNKYIRSYYDVTNLVVKDMNTNNLYTQGLMTLRLKRTSHNYMFRLYTLNSDNVRIPYDLTGPYRYKLIFPTTSSRKIEILPNTENSDLNYNIGQLIFYITEDQVKLIMNVLPTDRYFAIVIDVENNESQQSTIYEGKVSYF